MNCAHKHSEQNLNKIHNIKIEERGDLYKKINLFQHKRNVQSANMFTKDLNNITTSIQETRALLKIRSENSNIVEARRKRNVLKRYQERFCECNTKEQNTYFQNLSVFNYQNFIKCGNKQRIDEATKQCNCQCIGRGRAKTEIDEVF